MIKGTDFIGISVSSLVYHPEKGILLGCRTDQCRDERWKWDNWGGGLKFKETIMQGMQRELREEFGRNFREEQIHRLGYREQFREHDGKMTHRIAFYHLTLLSGDEQLQNMEPHKHSELQYFPLDNLPAEDACHSMLYPTLRQFQSEIEKLIHKKIVL